MNGRTNWLLAVVAILGALLLTCIGVAAFGLITYLLSGGIDIPYPDGPPPTPSVRP